MGIDTDDFDEVGYTHADFTEVVVRLRSGGWFGQYSRYFSLNHDCCRDDKYTKLADRLCGNVFILTSRGESESVRLNQAMPDANFIYPQMHRPDDWCEFVGEDYQPNVYELNVRRKAPFKMCLDHVTEEFRNTLRPYMADGGRVFWMNDDVFMLMKMKF